MILSIHRKTVIENDIPSTEIFLASSQIDLTGKQEINL